MTIKERIRELANSEGLSLPKLEEELGFGGGTISRWDTSVPAADKLAKIADRYNVTVDYLLGRDVKFYDDANTAAIAQEICINENLRMLFDVSRKAPPERLIAYYKMIKALEEAENGKE